MKGFSRITLALSCLVTSLATSNHVSAASIEFTNSTSTNSYFSRPGAVDFIKKYAAQPGYTVYPYTTFGSNDDGGDCTNFVSQAMFLGGGMQVHGIEDRNVNTLDWYYYGPTVAPAYPYKARTSSWTGADEFREHWGVINGVGGKHAYQMRKYSIQEASTNYYQEIYDELWNGDVVQYVNEDGITYHTQIVWNYGNGTINVAQHSTNDRPWTLDLGLLSQIRERAVYGGWVIILKMKQAST